MMLPTGLVPFLACLAAIAAAQVAGLLGYVNAMRALWLVAVGCGALSSLAGDRRPPGD